MADPQRTEQPTKRRREKARQEGKFPASREMVAAAQFLAFVALLRFWAPLLVERLRQQMRVLFQFAFRPAVNTRGLENLFRESVLEIFSLILVAGAGMALIAFAAQLGSTRLGISLQKLAPDFARLNPLQKIRELPAQNLAATAQALLIFPVLGLTVYAIARENLAAYLALPGLGLGAALNAVTRSYLNFLWKAAFAFAVLGSLDLLRQQRRFTQSLRMTKQELRDELKETDVNPQIKSHIRRLQRDAARRNMMKEVPTATAVVVNPTHYSVAIRYEMESMAAPRVVAKGRNYLARRIREIATEHQVPIVENQPLAQALYKSADVGQEIPPHLYRAVAEILAYIFKLMHQRRRA